MHTKLPYAPLFTLLLLLLFLCPEKVLADDFQITDEIVTAYYGPGGDITLPSNAFKVGTTAFLNNTEITSVTIPEGYHTIAEGAFDGCSNLKSVSLPDTLETIEKFAFARCASLESCYLPRHVSSIGNGAFRECHALTFLEIPEITDFIGEGCFCYCDSLDRFSVVSGNTSFCERDGALFTADMKMLIQYPCGSRAESYTVPAGVETICRNAFTHARSLREVRLADTVRELKSFAFSSCPSLIEIELPASLEHVSEYAFKNVSNLCRVYIKNNAMEIDPAAFIGAPSVVLYGEHGSEAESYARKQNIMFSAAEDNETVYPRTETIF
ncbi:MAG TPA: hypothetical protein DCX23_07045 [Lachnospiraceae bacterium]|nr:hypothetical protein [Lachnospiraceae bacterium]